MTQPFVSSTSQTISNPGWCIFSWSTNDGTGNVVSVSFSPVFARSLQYQLTPVQRLNISTNNTVHVFQLSTSEPWNIPINFINLPTDDYDPTDMQGEGFLTLLSFVRTTILYYERTFQLTTPDGLIETVRYRGGIDTFRDASGQSQKHNRWDGNLLLTRVTP